MLGTELGKKLDTCYVVLSIDLYGSETWTLRKLQWKYLGSFEMWCWKRIENIKRPESVNNEIIESMKEKRTLLNNILRRIIF